jgi:hypothetical protein
MKLFENIEGNKFKLNSPIKEAISEKNVALIEKWVKEHGARKASVKIIDSILRQRIGLQSADLADTATFANGLDEMEQLLNDGKYESVMETAVDTAKAMVDEEGGEGLF